MITDITSLQYIGQENTERLRRQREKLELNRLQNDTGEISF